jgi:hypothetical protein
MEPPTEKSEIVDYVMEVNDFTITTHAGDVTCGFADEFFTFCLPMNGNMARRLAKALIEAAIHLDMMKANGQ